MTHADVLTEAGGYLSDSSSTRWVEATRLRYYNRGRQLLFVQRPEAYFLTDIVTDEPDDVVTGDISGATAIDYAPEWGTRFAHFIAAMCFLEDAEDAHNMKLYGEHLVLAGIKP